MNIREDKFLKARLDTAIGSDKSFTSSSATLREFIYTVAEYAYVQGSIYHADLERPILTSAPKGETL